MVEPLPCPFCGGEPHEVYISEEGPNFGGSVIECQNCGASSPVHFDRKENLWDSWNTRPAPATEGDREVALETLEEMANIAQVPMDLWNRHSNAVLALANARNEGIEAAAKWHEDEGRKWTETARILQEQESDDDVIAGYTATAEHHFNSATAIRALRRPE